VANKTKRQNNKYMSDERQKVEVGLGEKCDAPDAEVVDTVKPEDDEVGGRYRRYNNVICPYCYASCRIIEETTQRMSFRCWNCGYSFRY
jgi:hypothetical protein